MEAGHLVRNVGGGKQGVRDGLGDSGDGGSSADGRGLGGCFSCSGGRRRGFCELVNEEVGEDDEQEPNACPEGPVSSCSASLQREVGSLPCVWCRRVGGLSGCWLDGGGLGFDRACGCWLIDWCLGDCSEEFLEAAEGLLQMLRRIVDGRTSGGDGDNLEELRNWKCAALPEDEGPCHGGDFRGKGAGARQMVGQLGKVVRGPEGKVVEGEELLQLLNVGRVAFRKGFGDH